MTFGYDANIFTKASSQRTFVFAEDLVSSLNDERTGSAALLIAQARASLYHDLLTSVRHLMFFGTPHQGTDSGAGFLNDLGAALLRANDGSVLRELKLWSPSLMEVNTLFIDIAEGFTITTFFEKEKTRGVQIVNEGSARLNKSKEQVIGLDGNHLQICKFPDKDDPMYVKVLRRLRAEVSQVQDVEAEREHERRVQQLLESASRVTIE
ncbi:hypothetical protein LTR70_009229 [Exophiala xenobiotica]|uniref:Uncharacterized protein n=1 Tax=Lithohypha guttulata TaxID=1690604 RepID=A0ABR0K0B8_9EURO|nr:hypothetical protein LTR24_008324 [Lithohypha guttulata]KAK5310771.1 hypothetical protein LTR70_009229 [Exophiala xenobiotica]